MIELLALPAADYSGYSTLVLSPFREYLAESLELDVAPIVF